MYQPRHFRERDPARLFGLIEAHPFGTLVAVGDDGTPEIAHVPFLLDRGAGGHGSLRCHVARANPVWRVAAGRPVTAVFRGPDAYVSASWYEHPAREVPTWNYAVVHAYGTARAPIDEGELRALLADLASAHESGPSPWTPERLDPAFLDELLREIVGVSIPLDRLDGKFKLSQNRTDADRARVRRVLAERAGPADLEMLRWMA